MLDMEIKNNKEDLQEFFNSTNNKEYIYEYYGKQN